MVDTRQAGPKIALHRQAIYVEETIRFYRLAPSAPPPSRSRTTHFLEILCGVPRTPRQPGGDCGDVGDLLLRLLALSRACAYDIGESSRITTYSPFGAIEETT